MASRVRKAAVVAGLVAFGATTSTGASAQTPPDPPAPAAPPDPGAPPAAPTPAVAPTDTTPPAPPPSAAPPAPPPPGPGIQVAAPSDASVIAPRARQPVRSTKGKARHVDHGLVATLPGFEILPDGGSRVFVELTRNTTVSEKRDARSLTYLIRGAHVNLRNNENALVTVHFNTPVTRARILPLHGDVVLTIELRADTPATYRVVDGTEGSVLQIDFPKGAFLAPGEFVPGTGTAAGL